VELCSRRERVGRAGNLTGLFVENGHMGDAIFAGDFSEPSMVAAGSDPDEFQLVAMSRDDPERRFTDGARRAKQDDAFAGN